MKELHDNNTVKSGGDANNKALVSGGLTRDLRDAAISSLSGLVAERSFAHVPAAVLATKATREDFAFLRDYCLNELAVDPNDPPETAIRRGYVTVIVDMASGRMIPVNRHLLGWRDNEAVLASGFNIGSENPDNPKARLFQTVPDHVIASAAFRNMVYASVLLDPAPAASKSLVACNVFIQGPVVDRARDWMPAAVPNKIHTDGCRSKTNFLIWKEGVDGGEASFFDRDYAGRVMSPAVKRDALATIDLREPGEGYSFLDEAPRPGETRKGVAHAAGEVWLAQGSDLGYRFLATVTPTPLLPFDGDPRAIEEARERFASNVSALFDMRGFMDALSPPARKSILNRIRPRSTAG